MRDPSAREDNAPLKDEFDRSLFPHLDWEQIFWLANIFQRANLFEGIDLSRYLGPARKPATANDEPWRRIAFFINAHCPNSRQLGSEELRKTLEMPGASQITNIGNENPFRKYSLWVQALPDPWFTFMNYGYYAPEYEDRPLSLVGSEKYWKYGVQFYHRVGSQIDLSGKDILEVGSGRGGGAAYVARSLKPRSMVAMDGTHSNVKFCERIHREPNLRFLAGKAEELPFADASFDAVINIESYGYYRPLEDFLGNLRRVLRSGGHFLMAGYGPFAKMFADRQKILDFGFDVVAEADISFNVNAALSFFGRTDLFRLVEENETVRSKMLYLEYLNAVARANVQHYYCYNFRKR